MRIIFVITGLGDGGAEKVVADLADQMQLRGHQVKIAYLKGRNIVVKPASQSVELIYLGLENLSNFIFASKRYRALIASFQPDIVHAHMVHANIFARLNRIGCSIPKLICSAHSNNEGGILRMLLYKITHQLANITTNVSQDASNNFELLGAVPKGEIKTIYNGVDLKKFNKTNELIKNKLREEMRIESDEFIFIAVGRFHEAKDYPNLIAAFSSLKKTSIFKKMQPKLIIVGDGELRKKIEFLISSLQLNQDILLLGRRDDITDLLNMSNFFVLSSKYEGLPTVVIEAMACHCFVIATDCGGSAEIMGDTGILVSPQDCNALAQGLLQALTKSANEIEINNRKARQRVEELFSLEKSVNTWLNLYENK